LETFQHPKGFGESKVFCATQPHPKYFIGHLEICAEYMDKKESPLPSSPS